MAFHWSLSDSKSPQIFRILHSILAILINAVVWMVSTRPPTSKSSSPFNNPLVTVPKAPTTIGIIVTFMFHSFFNSLARSRYLSFFSHSFSFILWSAGTAMSTILQILSLFFFFFFFDYCKVWSFGRDLGIHLYVKVRSEFVHHFIIIIIIIAPLRVIHTSVSSWFYTGVWMVASLHKFPGLLLVSRPILSKYFAYLYYYYYYYYCY